MDPEIVRRLGKKSNDAAHLNVASAVALRNFRIVTGFVRIRRQGDDLTSIKRVCHVRPKCPFAEICDVQTNSKASLYVILKEPQRLKDLPKKPAHRGRIQHVMTIRSRLADFFSR